MKRVLIHSLIFSPDGVSTAYLYNDIALRLQERGYDVVVLTTTPHFNIVPEQVEKQPMRWKVWGFCKVSKFNGMTVLHVPQKKFKSTALRLLGFVYWHIVSFFIGLTIRHVDLILSPSPPLTLGFLNLGLAKLKGCKVVYNVQEIYPDILKLKGGITLKFLIWMEKKVYNGSDAVTTIDRVFYDTIAPRFKDQSKLHIIPNFVDTDLYREVEWEGKLDSKLFPKNDSVKLLYAGNIGFAQDWELLVNLAEKCKEYPIEFVVIGEGVRKPFLENEKEKRNLDNIRILPYQPRNLMASILSYCDCSFIFMEQSQESDGFPSKVYTIMACKRPLLIASGVQTPIVNFLMDKNCSMLVTDNNLGKRVEIMTDWLHHINKDTFRKLGENGFDVIQKSYTKEIVTEKYAELVEQIIK